MPNSADSTPRFPNLLIHNRNFVLLWAAYGISAVGDHLSELALLDHLGGLERDDITRVQALIGFGFFLPFVVLGPLAGWFADRFSRKLTMIGADLLRAGVVASLPWTVPLLIGWGLGDYAAVLPLVVTGALAAFFSPARQAMIPTIIRSDQLVRANAMISALGTIGTILSAVLGGYLVKYKGRLWNYQIDGLTFIASAILLSFIAMRLARVTPHRRIEGLFAPLRRGFQYLAGHRRIVQLIALGAVFWGCAAITVSVIPAIVRDVFGGDIADAGKYRGLMGIGLASGAAIMTIVGPTMPLQIAVLGALAGGAFWVFALAATTFFGLGWFPAGLCLVLIGAHGAALLVTMMASLQRFVPDSRRGRVFGISDMSTTGAFVVASALLGLPHIPHLDRYVPLILLGAGGILSVTLLVALRTYQRGQPYRPLITVLWQFARFYGYFWLRVRRIGPCTIPREGPVIVAANHTAGVDPLILLATSPHRLMGFVVAREYYGKPFAGWWMRLVDCIPIDREHPSKSFLAGTLRHLRSGKCLAIFPQGTYPAPGEPPPPPRPGIAVIALRSGATVVPAHIDGTRYYTGPFRAYFSRHRARVRYGPPIDLSAFAGRERDPEAPQEIADLIMSRIQALAAGDESPASRSGRETA
jgi:1-acyl-sn-glycerol-3-phosphate acyltransferase